MKEEWLMPGAVVPVTSETVVALVNEIKRLIGVVGGMDLNQRFDWQGLTEHEWLRGECVKCGESMEKPECCCQEPDAPGVVHRTEEPCYMKEQPEQSSLDRMAENARELGLNYESVQEPVAWIERVGGGVSYDVYHSVARELPEGFKSDLYTTPQLNTKVNFEGIPKQISEPEQEQDGPICDGWQLSVANGHSGYGVYAHMTEYPEEGAVLVLPIEQPEQEPVAWMYKDLWGTMKLSQIMPPPAGAFPVYTTTPRREWVGLTEDEVEDLEFNSVDQKYGHLDVRVLSRAIEAKLREKNAASHTKKYANDIECQRCGRIIT